MLSGIRIATAIITYNRAAGLSDWRQQLRRADFPGNLSQRFSDRADPAQRPRRYSRWILDTLLARVWATLSPHTV